MCLGELGRHDESLRALQRSASIFRAHPERAGIELARVLDAEGVALRARGEFTQAIDLHREALRELERAREQRGFRPAYLVPVRVNLGEALLAAEQLPEARVELGLALAGFGLEDDPGQAKLQARALLLAARAWSSGEDAEEERARQLATRARALFGDLGLEQEAAEAGALLPADAEDDDQAPPSGAPAQPADGG